MACFIKEVNPNLDKPSFNSNCGLVELVLISLVELAAESLDYTLEINLNWTNLQFILSNTFFKAFIYVHLSTST